MAGLFDGLSKLVKLGAVHAQHVRAARAAAQLPDEEMLTQLPTYLKSLTPAQFSGFKISIAMEAQREGEPRLKQALSWMVSNADALLGHAVEGGMQASPKSVGNGATFEEDMRLIDGWYRATFGGQEDQVQRELRSYVKSCSGPAFGRFIEHVDQGLTNIRQNIEQEEQAERNGGGGYWEDRMSYRLAKFQTGQMDPQRAENIREYQRQLGFFSALRELSSQEFAVAHPASGPR